MQIFIPTMQRLAQDTFLSLPPSLRSKVHFVTPANETYIIGGGDSKVIRAPVMGIGHTRQWIIDNATDDKIVMLDDDLVFATRRYDDPTKFRESSHEEIHDLFDYIDSSLDAYAHVGVSTREGGNRDTSTNVWNSRLLRILAYRRDILVAEKIRFDRLELMEDFDVTLQLLRRGYANIRINSIVHNQRMSNAPGGCSTYRTLEKQSAAAIGLAALHPSFVSVVTKKTKTAWNGQERQDVRVQWKQAFQSTTAADAARAVTLLDKGA